MKQIRQILALTLSLAIILSLCACGSGQAPQSAPEDSAPQAQSAPEAPEAAEAPETAEAQESAPEEPAPEEAAVPAEFPTEGTYTMFGMLADGFLVSNEALERSSELTLSADGTGSLVLATPADSQTLAITGWTAPEGNLELTLEDGTVATGTVRGGILELNLFSAEGSTIYYAMEGADTSAYEVLSLEEYRAAYEAAHDSRLYALMGTLDTEAGVHMRYIQHTEYLDSTQNFDVHAKAGTYYSLSASEVFGREIRSVTFARDGVVYNLDPDEMTGLIATTFTSGLADADVMLMDSLFSTMFTCSRLTEYTVEEREMEGSTYSVEVFPGNEYQPEAAFYYDGDGTLRYCVEAPPTLSPDLGETVYTIEEIGGSVDESLFDISGYDIQEMPEE